MLTPEAVLREFDYNGMIFQLDGDEARLRLRPYWTVVIPPTTPSRWTKWHSSEELTRGAFNTEEEATAWAEKNLEGNDFRLLQIVCEPEVLSEEDKNQILIQLALDLLLSGINREITAPA